MAVGDARTTLRGQASGSADIVVGDAFGTYAVPWHLATTEWAQEVRRVLRPGGLYALNVIDYPPLELLRSEAATLMQVFEHVRLVAFPDADDQPAGGNAVLCASARPLPSLARAVEDGAVVLEGGRLAGFVGDAESMWDDFAPADQRLTIPFA